MNVFELANKRIEYIFQEFENIILSFSGGKDSGVLLNLTIDIARKLNRKIDVLFIDTEACYTKTIEFINRIINNNLDVIIPHWVCLPMESPNSLSFLDPTWIWWDEDKKDIWVREMPENCINIINNKYDFYIKNMPFEEFIKVFSKIYPGKVATLVGIRTQESLNRYRAIYGDKNNYKDKNYSTLIDHEKYNFYPLFDWKVTDIWTYNGKYNKDYNKLYDLFYKAGVSLSKMRVDEPFGNEAKAGLNLFRILEPSLWNKTVNRVSGANFGNIYHGKKIMNCRYTLPGQHNWRSFCKFLLNTLPEKTKIHYKNRFIKFIKYWNKIGCPCKAEHIEILENKYSEYIVNTNKYSNRGKKDKFVIKFIKIPDSIPELETKDDILSWKKLAMCIIKNDYVCKSLSFSTTKTLITQIKELKNE